MTKLGCAHANLITNDDDDFFHPVMRVEGRGRGSKAKRQWALLFWSLHQLPLTSADSLYWNARTIGHYQVFGYDVWLETYSLYNKAGKKSHSADQRLDPIYYALWVCFLDYKQLPSLLSDRWCRHGNKHHNSESHRSVFSVLWIQHEKMRGLSFSNLVHLKKHKD